MVFSGAYAQENTTPQLKGLVGYEYSSKKENILLSIRKACAEKIIALSNNETGRALFPGGWRGVDRESGHEILLYLEKMPDNLYRIIILNTGDGLDYHLQKNFFNKVKYCPARVFDRLDFNNAVSLIEACVVCAKSDTIVFQQSQSKFNAEYIYKQVLANFKDFEASPFNAFPTYITPQRAGTCTAKIFSPIERLIFGAAFNKYKLIMKKITNQYYLEQIRANKERGGVITPDEIEMLRHSLQNFSRRLAKSKELSSDETKHYVEVLRGFFSFIEQVVTEREEKQLSEVRENVVSEVVWPQQVEPYHLLGYNNFVRTRNTKKTKEKEQETLKLRYYSFDIFSEKPCAEFLSQLAQYKENK